MSKKKSDKIFNAHLLNYRMAFDTMRSYHSSEIEHKKDMITILNNVFISNITVFAGIFYFILSTDYDEFNEVSIIVILIITSLYIALILKLKIVNAKKMKADNLRYEKFRIECQIERDYLKLSKYFIDLEVVDNIYWSDGENNNVMRTESGYNKTLSLISIYCNILMFITGMLSFVSIIIIVKQIFG